MGTPFENYDELIKFFPDESFVRRKVDRLKAIAPDIQMLRQLQILDLGCGSEDSKDAFIEDVKIFSPWYCRLAHAAGADVLGIDIADNRGEDFRSERRDLLQPGSLDDLPSESFDAVNNDGFTVSDESFYVGLAGQSPTALRMALRQCSLWKRLNILDHSMEIAQEQLQKINQRIRNDVSRLLRDGGLYSNMELIYRKIDGGLVLQKERLI